MQILTPDQIRNWDAYTIEHEPVSSVDLMERAVSTSLEWLRKNDYLRYSFTIFCGKGNNGGDGLALARLLSESQCTVKVYILEFGNMGTEDFQTNLARLHQTNVEILFIQSNDHLPVIPEGSIVIDALFGSGLNRPLEGITSLLVQHINKAGKEVIAIDIPSGMFADKSSKGNQVVKALHTLSFQCYKQAFLMPENEEYFGDIHILDIGLHAGYLKTIHTDFELIEPAFIKAVYRPRKSFSHKGSFGHALLVTGSYGKMGASVLCTKACLRGGVGLLSCMIPAFGYDILQIAVPEAMAIPDSNNYFINAITTDITKYNVIGIGPGLGTETGTSEVLAKILSDYEKPVVIDADALNILSANKDLLSKIQPFSILTPHPKEFERLFGSCSNDWERMDLARQNAKTWQVIIVLKGHNTFIAMPGGKGYFNTTGNAGMATGGSGDVLTGILTGLLAQGYPPEHAAILGVYLHGLAGDIGSKNGSQESLIASDIIENLGGAYQQVLKYT